MIFGPIAWAILPTMCYKFGWIFDVDTERDDPRKTLFQAGLIFCIILTVLPGLRVVTAYLITIHRGQKLDCDARSFLANCP